MFWSSVVLAAREIRRNVFRSGLTVLGVVIGVAAVVAIVTIGGGATARISGEISALGADLLIVSPGGDRRGPPGPGRFGVRGRRFSMEEVAAVESLKNVRTVAPTAMRPTLVRVGDRRRPGMLTGTTSDYQDVRRVTLEKGVWFDDAADPPECVLGSAAATELFGEGADVVGSRLQHERGEYVVCGVCAPSGGGPMGGGQDRAIFVPLGSFADAGERIVDVLFVKASSNDEVESARQEVTAVLRTARGLEDEDPADFSIRGVEQILAMVRRTTGILTAVIGSIAGISLLVGGIGITNVMLVTITERTREIGVRMSIGAQGRDVLLQFLIESSMLTGAGGLFGIAVGLSGGWLATHFIELPFSPNLLVMLGVFAFSVTLGLVFGLLPARRAALMNPVDALRHE